jgi:CBS domain-containing protein
MSTRLGNLATAVEAIATPDTTAARAAQLMRTHHVGALVVIDSGAGPSRPIGIVTDRDLVLAVMAPELDPALFTVGDVMLTSPVTAPATTGLEEAMALMREHQIRRLIVVDDEARVVGIATMEDLLAAMASEFSQLVLALHGARDRERAHHTEPLPA